MINGRIQVGLTISIDGGGFYNIFSVENKSIKEWSSMNSLGFTFLSDMSYDKPMNLLPIVRNWLIVFERNLKINNIKSKF